MRRLHTLVLALALSGCRCPSDRPPPPELPTGRRGDARATLLQQATVPSEQPLPGLGVQALAPELMNRMMRAAAPFAPENDAGAFVAPSTPAVPSRD